MCFSYFTHLHSAHIPLDSIGAENPSDTEEDRTILRYGRLRQTDPEDRRTEGLLPRLPAKHSGHHSLRWHRLGRVRGVFQTQDFKDFYFIYNTLTMQ